MKRIRKKLIKGNTRRREGFLFFPKTINDETRWLCNAKWEQTVIETYEYDDICGPISYLVWVDFLWLD